MLKKKISFQISHLKSLLDSESSCVTVVNNFKGKISLFPFHLGYLKHAVKELLEDKVSKYDPELNGIVLGHSNIKVINLLQHTDSSKIDLSYIADVYLFTPVVGKTLTGLINKKSKEHIGCLIHSAFNASIPKPRSVGIDLSVWLRTHGTVQIGNELDFTVSKVDFSSRVPYISGIIVRRDPDSQEEEVDSGCCQDSTEDMGTKVKKKKRKSQENFMEIDVKKEDVSYHDPDKISELLNPDIQVGKDKKKKSKKTDLVDDFDFSTPSPSKRVKKEKYCNETEDDFAYTPDYAKRLKESNVEEFWLPLSADQIKKERLSVSPCSSESSSSRKKSKSKHSLDKNEIFNVPKVKTEPSFDELTTSLLKEAMDNCYSPKPAEVSSSSESDKKKKKKKIKDNIDHMNHEDRNKLSLQTDSNVSMKQKKLSFPKRELDIQGSAEMEEKKSRKRKRSESSIKSDNEDSFVKISKKKKSRRSKDNVEELSNLLLADTISKLQ